MWLNISDKFTGSSSHQSMICVLLWIQVIYSSLFLLFTFLVQYKDVLTPESLHQFVIMCIFKLMKTPRCRELI